MLGKAATDDRPATRIGHFYSRHGMAVDLLLLLVALGAVARGQTATDSPSDAERYIGIDEIKAGMDAYCLTDYGEAGIEKFALKVVDVVHNMDPGHDAILVMGVDERFQHTGPVGGCSGSPVYIDDRLAGALAFGRSF